MLFGMSVRWEEGSGSRKREEGRERQTGGKNEGEMAEIMVIMMCQLIQLITLSDSKAMKMSICVIEMCTVSIEPYLPVTVKARSVR